MAPYRHALIGIALVAMATPPGAGAATPGPDEPLDMTEPVACRKVRGYGEFERLEGAALTRDDKLIVYYEPLHYRVDHSGRAYHARLIQDVRVRRHGRKEVLWKKDRLLDYEVKQKVEPGPLFLTNTIAVKGLTPGDYDLDLILHDPLVKDGPTVTRTLKFTIKPSPTSPAPRPEAGDEADEGRKVEEKPGS